MKRLITAVVLLLMVLAGTAQAMPDFINGGFENNNFDGWTRGGDTNITSAGFDIRTNNALQTVAPGLAGNTHSARVGDETCWGRNGPASSSLGQIETVQTGDLQDLYFAWAAVGLVPANGQPHSLAETPWFQVEVNWHHQGGGVQNLASEQFYTGNPGAITPGWLEGVYDNGETYGHNDAGIWYYRPWTTYHLNLAGVGILVGDQLEAVLTTRDCTLGGHASYAYLDGFGDTPPILGDVPEPSTTVLLGLVMVSVAAGGFLRRRKK